ncbi:MAG: lipoprotein [Muribaculaceae bacterium]|nr:lipoprotein [Muribaculaceae bacterium]
MKKYILATIIAVFLTGCGEESKKIQAAQQLGENMPKKLSNKIYRIIN